jgi:hypothetical protein
MMLSRTRTLVKEIGHVQCPAPEFDTRQNGKPSLLRSYFSSRSATSSPKDLPPILSVRLPAITSSVPRSNSERSLMGIGLSNDAGGWRVSISSLYFPHHSPIAQNGFFRDNTQRQGSRPWIGSLRGVEARKKSEPTVMTTTQRNQFLCSNVM